MTTKLIATALAVVYLVFGAGIAAAQPLPDGKSSADSQGTRSVFPEAKGQMQPQGPTGPLKTEGPTAAAENPQGETPPGM